MFLKTTLVLSINFIFQSSNMLRQFSQPSLLSVRDRVEWSSNSAVVVVAMGPLHCQSQLQLLKYVKISSFFVMCMHGCVVAGGRLQRVSRSHELTCHEHCPGSTHCCSSLPSNNPTHLQHLHPTLTRTQSYKYSTTIWMTSHILLPMAAVGITPYPPQSTVYCTEEGNVRISHLQNFRHCGSMGQDEQLLSDTQYPVKLVKRSILKLN